MSAKVSTWAEVIGIAALVISLVFVGVEIRQNTEVAAAQAVLELNLGFNEQLLAVADNEELSQIIAKGNADTNELGSDEFNRYQAYTNALFNIQESALTFRRNGIVDEDEIASFVKTLCAMVSTPGGQKDFWEMARETYPAYFRATIEAEC